VLSVVAGADGRASNIVVLKAQPYGLTAKAVEAVSSWTFKPARDPHRSGKVVARKRAANDADVSTTSPISRVED